MVPIEPMDDELDLRHYLDVVSRRKWLISVVTLLVAAADVGSPATSTA